MYKHVWGNLCSEIYVVMTPFYVRLCFDIHVSDLPFFSSLRLRPSPSSIAAFSLQIGKTCHDCIRNGNIDTIDADAHLVASSMKPWHVSCAPKHRREMVKTITLGADERATVKSAERSRNETASRATPAKRPHEVLGRGVELDLSWTFKSKWFLNQNCY